MKICIDAGHNHSGWDTGAVANGLKEQDVTYSIARLLQTKLAPHGIQTVMTRESSTQNLGTSVTSCLKARAEISNRENCDYFVSIHCNAGGGTGTEVLVIKKGGQAEQLAEKVLSALTQKLSLRSRGVKQANLLVLRETKCPAILVETAFLDHPSDALLLKSKQEEFASSIATGILNHLNIPTQDELSLVKKQLAEKWGLSDPEAVFALLDTHPYRKDLYAKLLASYERS